MRLYKVIFSHNFKACLQSSNKKKNPEKEFTVAVRAKTGNPNLGDKRAIEH